MKKALSSADLWFCNRDVLFHGKIPFGITENPLGMYHIAKNAHFQHNHNLITS